MTTKWWIVASFCAGVTATGVGFGLGFGLGFGVAGPAATPSTPSSTMDTKRSGKRRIDFPLGEGLVKVDWAAGAYPTLPNPSSAGPRRGLREIVGSSATATRSTIRLSTMIAVPVKTTIPISIGRSSPSPDIDVIVL